MVLGQEPTKEQKKDLKKKFKGEKVFVDTSTVVTRPNDDIYLEQTKALNALDSLIMEKQKK